MAETQSPAPDAVPISAVPQYIAQEQNHVPAVSSPLNPDVKPRPAKTAAPREQRERKESQKKRESTAATGRGSTPTVPAKRKASHATHTAPSPMRFQILEPKLGDYDPPRPTVFLSHEPSPFITPDGKIELKKPADQYVVATSLST